MGKFTPLLVLAGLAVGLWLGFNPTTHKELMRLWDSGIATQAYSQPRTLANLRQLDRRVSLFLRSSPTTEASPRSERTAAPTWAKISAAFQGFWRALQEIWLRLTAKIGVGKL
jgi:hypothetical protein